jgi:hypothetical protein
VLAFKFNLYRYGVAGGAAHVQVGGGVRAGGPAAQHARVGGAGLGAIGPIRRRRRRSSSSFSNGARVTKNTKKKNAKSKKEEEEDTYSLPLNGAASLAWLERFSAPGGGGSRRDFMGPPAGALASLDVPPPMSLTTRRSKSNDKLTAANGTATATAVSTSGSASVSATSSTSLVNELGDDEHFIFNTTSARAARAPPPTGLKGLKGLKGEGEGSALEETESARLSLTLLAVLGCPDNVAVGLTKPWWGACTS